MLFAWQMKFDAPAENRWATQTCYFRACLHGGGGPQVGKVTRLGGVPTFPYNLSFYVDDVYMIGGGNPPRRVV